MCRCTGSDVVARRATLGHSVSNAYEFSPSCSAICHWSCFTPTVTQEVARTYETSLACESRSLHEQGNRGERQVIWTYDVANEKAFVASFAFRYKELDKRSDGVCVRDRRLLDEHPKWHLEAVAPQLRGIGEAMETGSCCTGKSVRGAPATAGTNGCSSTSVGSICSFRKSTSSAKNIFPQSSCRASSGTHKTSEPDVCTAEAPAAMFAAAFLPKSCSRYRRRVSSDGGPSPASDAIPAARGTGGVDGNLPIGGCQASVTRTRASAIEAYTSVPL